MARMDERKKTKISPAARQYEQTECKLLTNFHPSITFPKCVCCTGSLKLLSFPEEMLSKTVAFSAVIASAAAFSPASLSGLPSARTGATR
eukprot:748739-Hanusia_phi.AAC.2